MILTCSSGHKFNTDDLSDRIEYGDEHLVENGKCPALLSCDIMSGNTRCRRKLKKVIPLVDIFTK